MTRLQAQLGGELYLAGGLLRDLLLGRLPTDIDLVVASGARDWGKGLVTLSGGCLVPLGREEDETARVVHQGLTVDIAAFRQGTQNIHDDLRYRDLSINALAVRIDSFLDPSLLDNHDSGNTVHIIDPTGGLADLRCNLIRATHAQSFTSDPLRMLRVFRFAATLGFTVETATFERLRQQAALIHNSAPERMSYEMHRIMAADKSHDSIRSMAESGLLWQIIPELAQGIGVEQPPSHHLDVWEHNLETLHQMERILAAPAEYFPDALASIHQYLVPEPQRLRLKWAALLHDLGKPATCGRREDKGGRITFYHHDRVGAKMLHSLALRMRWSNEEREEIARLISEHMRPFHLANAVRAGNLTLRAAIRLIRQLGAALPGLFLLAMADSLAGKGVERIAGMEAELAALCQHLMQVQAERVAPAQVAPPLLTGHDLIEQLHLTPGSIFRHILDAVSEAQMTGEVGDTEAALRLARDLAQQASPYFSPKPSTTSTN